MTNQFRSGENRPVPGALTLDRADDREAIQIDRDVVGVHQDPYRILGKGQVVRQAVATWVRDEERETSGVRGKASCLHGTRLVDFERSVDGQGGRGSEREQ